MILLRGAKCNNFIEQNCKLVVIYTQTFIFKKEKKKEGGGGTVSKSTSVHDAFVWLISQHLYSWCIYRVYVCVGRHFDRNDHGIPQFKISLSVDTC